MISDSLLVTGLPRRSLVRRLGHTPLVTCWNALQIVLEQKAKEFVEKGSEVYAKA